MSKFVVIDENIVGAPKDFCETDKELLDVATDILGEVYEIEFENVAEAIEELEGNGYTVYKK